jgi:4-amino-4-deoxy-L-arabinose transferase-like glycosyltransferase
MAVASPLKPSVTRAWRFWAVLGLVFVLARVATWGYPFDSDHWWFFYVGRTWFHGGDLYVAAWDHKPPLVFLINGLMSLALGDDLVLHRIWLTALTVLDIALFAVLLRTLIRPLIGDLDSLWTPSTLEKVALLLYVFFRNLSQFTASGNDTEAYGLILLLAMWLAYLAFRRTGNMWQLALAGLCFSFLFVLKENYLLLVIPVGVLVLLQHRRSPPRLALESIVFLAPLVLQVLAWIAYFWSRGTLREAYIACFTFSAKYAGSAWAGKVSANPALFIISAIMLVPALFFFALFLRDIRIQRTNIAYQIVGMSFTAGLVLFSTVGTFYPYYQLIFMPFIVIVLAYGMTRLRSAGPALRRTAAGVLIATAIASYGVSLKQLQNSITGPDRALADQNTRVADYIRGHTTATDTIFDYRYGAAMYILADRRSGSRFVSASVLLLDYRDHYGFGLDKIFMNDMDRSRAKYVVMETSPTSLYAVNRPLIAYFTAHYRPEKAIGSLVVLRRD